MYLTTFRTMPVPHLDPTQMEDLIYIVSCDNTERENEASFTHLFSAEKQGEDTFFLSNLNYYLLKVDMLIIFSVSSSEHR